jgi:hypothetical protein
MDAISKPLISEHLQRKNQLKFVYRISVTSEYLSHSMSPKGLFIGRLRGKRPRLTNMSWISDNIKTLGVFHGYNIHFLDLAKV